MSAALSAGGNMILSREERYVNDFAQDCIKSIQSNHFRVSWEKQKAVDSIKELLTQFHYGRISVREAMIGIASA